MIPDFIKVGEDIRPSIASIVKHMKEYPTQWQLSCVQGWLMAKNPDIKNLEVSIKSDTVNLKGSNENQYLIEYKISPDERRVLNAAVKLLNKVQTETKEAEQRRIENTFLDEVSRNLVFGD